MAARENGAGAPRRKPTVITTHTEAVFMAFSGLVYVFRLGTNSFADRTLGIGLAAFSSLHLTLD